MTAPATGTDHAMSRKQDTDALLDTDAGKLRVLADWHDVQDDERGYEGEREVQADLRRIADRIEAAEARLSDMEHAVVESAYIHGPRCHDCADHDGRCPLTGRLCDPFEAALERLREATITERALSTALAANEALQGALQRSPCPFPLPEAEDRTVAACLKANVCGCENAGILAALPQQPEGKEGEPR